MKSESKKPTRLEHLIAILQLPFVVAILFPILIGFFADADALISLHKLPVGGTFVFGLLLLGIGFFLFVKSVILFDKIGRGTLAPWNPTKHIVVEGLYRHVRNPMIIGVVLFLMGEGFLFRSGNVLLWAFVFLITSHLFFILKEEPDLVKKFGDEYREYCKHVPRWIPRLKAWRPEDA